MLIEKSAAVLGEVNQASESKRLFIADRDQEDFQRDLKNHYHAAFTPNYGIPGSKQKLLNQSTSNDLRDDTIISNKSTTRKRPNLNKTVDYGTIASDDESFFRAIDHQIKDLDMKIHKTKVDISNIKNTSETNVVASQPGSNSNRFLPDGLASMPTIKTPNHNRQNSLSKPPLGQSITQPRVRPTSQESRNSDTSTVFAKKERENNKMYDLQNDPYGTGRLNSEDSEPPRPGSNKHRILLPSLRQNGSERGDGLESPLFDIAQDIEKRNHPNPTNPKSLNNFILVNNNINTIKEEPNEDQRSAFLNKSRRDSQNELNSKRSNQSQQRIGGTEEKSVEQQIAEVQPSLEGYKKQLNPGSRDGNPPTVTSRGNNSGRISKDVPKQKSQNTLLKPDETKEEKIDNYLKYFE